MGRLTGPAEEGLLTYGEYLKVPELLSVQQLRSDPPVHDELLFITVHQTYELWFRQMLIELTDARDRLMRGETYLPRLRLQRCHVVERLLVSQFDVLDTMSPFDFLQFRHGLGSSSGIQSVQFHEIELLSGLNDPHRPHQSRLASKADRERLRRRLAEPTLWDGLLTVLRKAGFDVSTKPERIATYTRIARNREEHADLWDLTEALVEHDQAWAAWRIRHTLTVERQIGARPGTGGTAGGSYLTSRHDTRFYPELWECRMPL